MENESKSVNYDLFEDRFNFVVPSFWQKNYMN